MNIRQDAQLLFSLDKMSQFDIINIAEQTAKVSGCSGVLVFVLDHDYRVTGAKLFLQNNKPVTVDHFDFSIEDCEHLNTGVINTQYLVINGRNLLEHHCSLSKLLFHADSTPVGCAVLLADSNQQQNPTLQLWMSAFCL